MRSRGYGTGKTALPVMMDNMRVAAEQATMLYEELLSAG